MIMASDSAYRRSLIEATSPDLKPTDSKGAADSITDVQASLSGKRRIRSRQAGRSRELREYLHCEAPLPDPIYQTRLAPVCERILSETPE